MGRVSYQELFAGGEELVEPLLQRLHGLGGDPGGLRLAQVQLPQQPVEAPAQAVLDGLAGGSQVQEIKTLPLKLMDDS